MVPRHRAREPQPPFAGGSRRGGLDRHRRDRARRLLHGRRRRWRARSASVRRSFRAEGAAVGSDRARRRRGDRPVRQRSRRAEPRRRRRLRPRLRRQLPRERRRGRDRARVAHHPQPRSRRGAPRTVRHDPHRQAHGRLGIRRRRVRLGGSRRRGDGEPGRRTGARSLPQTRARRGDEEGRGGGMDAPRRDRLQGSRRRRHRLRHLRDGARRRLRRQARPRRRENGARAFSARRRLVQRDAGALRHGRAAGFRPRGAADLQRGFRAAAHLSRRRGLRHRRDHARAGLLDRNRRGARLQRPRRGDHDGDRLRPDGHAAPAAFRGAGARSAARAAGRFSRAPRLAERRFEEPRLPPLRLGGAGAGGAPARRGGRRRHRAPARPDRRSRLRR